MSATDAFPPTAFPETAPARKMPENPAETPPFAPVKKPSLKAQIRRRLLELRDRISDTEMLAAVASVREHVRAWAPYRDASCICAYVAVRREMPTAGLILRALENGKTVIAPKVFGKELRFFRIKNLTDDFSRGAFGVLEPNEDCEEILPSRADVCLVPGVVFDEKGNRYGYGKGYYDRFLRALPPAIPTLGLAYDCQVLPEIPAAPFDVPVQYLVTPNRGVFKTAR